MPDDLPALDVLLPLGVPRLQPLPGEPELIALFGDSPGVRANMVSTVDGSAVGANGLSGSINNPADWRVFRVLRALADVVLVGAGTVRAEGYTALSVVDDLRAARAALGRADDLELAVVSTTGDLPAALLDGERPPIVITVAHNPALWGLRKRIGRDRVLVTADEHRVDPRAAVRALAARGLRHVLAEGGPSLLARLIEADVVDEVCLTWSPQLVGGPAGRILSQPSWYSPVRDVQPLHLLHADGVLLGRWRVARLGA
ncbi:dihydrofolate reductase family protein [Cellulomonas sp. URHD0024]|uniref:dihydrofolate reductase family protein n=1 Tax=Cellulomonas sp. URHD0024 TaxID=1302620 RepID=UPI000411055F|nr:dihydrofolate reductase family protein [Cellulomonas sp. URHD0024]